MIPRQYQIKGADEAYQILKKYGMLYLDWEERTGKSLTACLIAEQALVIKVLIITKKKGKPDWDKLFINWEHNKVYKVVTYTQLDKLDIPNWDLIILDECHNYISSLPKLPPKWKHVRKIVRDKAIIFMSATPCAQTPAQLFHQLTLSNWCHWRKYQTYKEWHKVYGEPYTAYLYKRQIAMYDHVDDSKVLSEVKHLFHTKTRKQVNFKYEPEDELHYITLNNEIKILYNFLLKHKVYEIPQIDEENIVIEYDTKTKLRFGLHMLEGGTLKYTTYILNRNNKPKPKVTHFDIGNTEKIDYIKENWGDKQDVAIMYNYISEGKKLNNHFKNAAILQATTHAESIDLMHFEHLIIYSQDFSTAKHVQRRARQTNLKRNTPITVHFLLVKKGISEEVYETVSINKQNYVDIFFKGNKI